MPWFVRGTERVLLVDARGGVPTTAEAFRGAFRRLTNTDGNERRLRPRLGTVIAAAVFASRGLWLPWQDKESFLKATVKHSPKIQCLALIAIGWGLSAIPGTVAGWFADGRAWLLDAITSSASWALGPIGVLAVAVFGVIILADYIVPGGLEPDKPVVHMVMWVASLLVFPLLQLALGSISLTSLIVIFFVMWFINVKFRGKKRTGTAAPAATR